MPPSNISFSKAFLFWLKLGFISFGGPAGQIAVMHQELVEKKRWISERRFLHALNYCMLLPGPEAQQLATYIGWLMHGIKGGIMAGGLFVLPSVFILIALSWVYMTYGHVPALAGALYGIKPAVTAIVLFAAYRIGSRALKNNWLKLIAAASFIAIFFLEVPFPAIILAAGLIGFVGSKVAPALFTLGNSHGSAKESTEPAMIDDDTPTPQHARFSLRKLIAVTIAGTGLWAGALGTLAWRSGWQDTLTQMGWFFTKAALLTFGGAYAVLPYVYQGVVDHYGWLTPSQMIDGLALGETTPGPLIMVVAFVGFVGGWVKSLFGPGALFHAGAAGALVATYFTFLPSFLFIIIGGPLVESTHGDLKFTAPLTAITAAVVGVIINLALFFALHVLWPEGTAATPFAGHFEWVSLLVGIVSFVALFRFKVGMIPVIAACAVAGLLYRLASG